MSLQLQFITDRTKQAILIQVVDPTTNPPTVQPYGVIQLSLKDFIAGDLASLNAKTSQTAKLQQIGTATTSPVYILGTPLSVEGSDGNFHSCTLQEVKVMQIISGVCKQRSQIFLCSAIYQGAGDPA